MLTRLVCTQSYFIWHSRFVALKELNMSVLALSFRYFLVLFNFVVVVSRHYHLLL